MELVNDRWVVDEGYRGRDLAAWPAPETPENPHSASFFDKRAEIVPEGAENPALEASTETSEGYGPGGFADGPDELSSGDSAPPWGVSGLVLRPPTLPDRVRSLHRVST